MCKKIFTKYICPIYLAASRRAALSLSVVCFTSSKLLVRLSQLYNTINKHVNCCRLQHCWELNRQLENDYCQHFYLVNQHTVVQSINKIITYMHFDMFLIKDARSVMSKFDWLSSIQCLYRRTWLYLIKIWLPMSVSLVVKNEWL